jgi:hypothetical protein
MTEKSDWAAARSPSSVLTVPDPVEIERVLECAECGRRSEIDADGWRTMWTDDEPPARNYIKVRGERVRPARRSFASTASSGSVPGDTPLTAGPTTGMPRRSAGSGLCTFDRGAGVSTPAVVALASSTSLL